MNTAKGIRHIFPDNKSEDTAGYPPLEKYGFVRYWTDILCAGESAPGWTPPSWCEQRLSRWANPEINLGLYVMEYYRDGVLMNYHYIADGPNIEVTKSKSVYVLPKDS